MKLKKILTSILVILFMLTLGNVSAAAADLTSDSRASITLTHAVAGDKFSIYKVIDIAYNEEKNILTYTWNNSFQGYFDEKNLTVDEFAVLNSDDLKKALADLPNYISRTSVSALQQEIAADGNGCVLFSELAVGGYFIRPTSTTHVYNTIFDKIEPSVNESTKKYELFDTDRTIVSKHIPVSVTKTADKESATIGEPIHYTIEVDIPTYDVYASDKFMNISDSISRGLTFQGGSLKVSKYAPAQDRWIEAGSAEYTLTPKSGPVYSDVTETTAFSITTINYNANWSSSEFSKIKVEYDAYINENAILANPSDLDNTGNMNTAVFEYSNYPYVTNSHKTVSSEVNIYTYGIVIEKYDTENPAKKLENAKFTLYRDAYADESTTETIVVSGVSKKVVAVAKNLSTGAGGIASFKYLEANGRNYNYYLVETAAPTGYNLLTEPVTLNFTRNDVETDGTYIGYFAVEIANKSGFILPVTGGTGTILFTVCGIALMSAAIVLLIVTKKKKSDKRR